MTNLGGSLVCLMIAIAFVAALGHLIGAALIYALVNWILPIFSLNYPLTFFQCVGAAIGLTILRLLIGRFAGK